MPRWAFPDSDQLSSVSAQPSHYLTTHEHTNKTRVLEWSIKCNRQRHDIRLCLTQHTNTVFHVHRWQVHPASTSHWHCVSCPQMTSSPSQYLSLTLCFMSTDDKFTQPVPLTDTVRFTHLLYRLTPTAGIWVQLWSILCQTGLSCHL